ncbi:MAG: hypothetical protein J5I93_08095 [Pirellulaceae bacterium]|nr:hypothetical protein [Pirellulaceae bacterium]
MLRRLLNLFLLSLALTGTWLAWEQASQQGALRERYQQLAEKVGMVEVEQPDKLHVRAVPTGEPLHWAWHIYVPDNYHMQLRSEIGTGTSSSHGYFQNEGYRDLARVRLRKLDGVWQIWEKLHGGSSYSYGLGEEIERQLDQFEKLRVEQLGEDKLQVSDGQEVLTLLRISAPSDTPGQPDTTVVVLRVGTEQAWQKFDSAPKSAER